MDFTVHVNYILDIEKDIQEQLNRKIMASEVKEGKFYVAGDEGKFNWLVYAKRQKEIAVEPFKNKVKLQGDGPYKYLL